MKKQDLLLRTQRSVFGSINCDPYIIAEIGTNHDQSKDILYELVDKILGTDCNCIKFQIYEPDEIVSKNVRASEYGLDALYGDISAHEMFDKHLKTPKDWFPEILDYIHKSNKDCMATIHGSFGLEWSQSLDFDLIKVASMDHNNFPFLKELVNNVGCPLLVSFGMADYEDIEKAINILNDHRYGYGVFYCSSVYPPNKTDLFLGNIPIIANSFSVPVGFSDHSLEPHFACCAVGLGASIFEKHVTLDRKRQGPDHPSAVTVEEFSYYCRSIKESHSVINEKFSPPSARESSNKLKYTKSIISRFTLEPGHVLTSDDLYLARPGTGIAPEFLDSVVGLTVRRRISSEEPLQWTDLIK